MLKAEAVCIMVENLAVPTDRRVWGEARALRDAGFAVSVICPKGKMPFEASYEVLEGIQIYRHRTFDAHSSLGYLLEYGFAWIAELYLVLKVFARTRFRVLQGCNPPDNIFLFGLLLKPFGVRFVFDHHDLSPELIDAKFGSSNRLLGAMARFAEWCSFRTADVSIATNESFKEIAIRRGGKSSEKVFVVRNCPDRASREAGRVSRLRKKTDVRFQIVYVGFMGKQDGLDLLLEAIDRLVNGKKRTDVNFVLVGGGTMLPELRATAASKRLDSVVTFTGQVPHDEVLRQLSKSDIGVAPDPKTPMNDNSTMIKIFEYMAFGLPIVLFDLKEGRRVAGAAALYAEPNEPADFANKLEQLLDSSELREQLGTCGRKRIEDEFTWENEKENLLRAYRTALNQDVRAQESAGVATDTQSLIKPQL
jgi:glycosyltransferase involved in cell wall biosynthesis